MKNVYTVSEVNSYIKNMFAQDYMLRSIIVSGEVSNVKYHSSGHVYFTIKDEGAALACVMFSTNAKKMSFRLIEGMKIDAAGSVNIYEKTGSYQLYVTTVRQSDDGTGALYKKYEELKKELELKGMFDKQHKKSIPAYAKVIGIVTAPTGAAIQDMISIAHRRNPYVQLILYPALVQGEGAKETIVAGIKSLENLGVDVIIVGRGGGSIEDLWAFNEECVAKAIYDCSVPIVSAVGHETDTTISDFVADRRAATPSEAAELTVFSYEEYDNLLHSYSDMLLKEMKRKVDYNKSYVNINASKLSSLSPASQIRIKRINYMNMVTHLDDLMNGILERQRRRYENMAPNIDVLMENIIGDNKHKLAVYIETLRGLSPLDRIEQGFAGISTQNRVKINSVSQVELGQHIHLTLRDGKIEAKVEDIKEENLERSRL